MKRAYEAWKPHGETIEVVSAAANICTEYREQGYELTLRQLYYQFVARGHLPNSDKSYNRLGNIVNKARLAGLIDWSDIVDRTRSPQWLPHWSDPADIISSISHQYRKDKWTDQSCRIEIWVEKEALAAVIERTADQWDCPWFSCRGYTSASSTWEAAQRIGGYIADGQRAIILHLGDHDPSGIDMTRDIRDRLSTFIQHDLAHDYNLWDEGGRINWDDVPAYFGNNLEEGNGPFEVRRIALTIDQVREHTPPPNPTKLTDSRANDYIASYGYESWELDALSPAILGDLITDEIMTELDMDKWNQVSDEIDADRQALAELASQSWDAIKEFTETNQGDNQ